MSDPRTDELSARLHTMARDADGVALADSAEVRRRGTQRRRTAIAASGLAAVIVVAVGASLAAGVLDRPETAAPPAATSSPTASSDRGVLTLAADPFLTGSELGQVGPYTSFKGQPTAKPVPLPDCLGLPSTWGANDSVAREFTSDLDATFAETLLVFDTEAQAMDAAREMNPALKNCYPGDDARLATWDVTGPGSPGELHVVRRTDTPQGDGGIDYSELAVVRTGNLIIWLDWSSLGSPFAQGPPAAPADRWVWTVQAITAAVDRAIEH